MDQNKKGKRKKKSCFQPIMKKTLSLDTHRVAIPGSLASSCGPQRPRSVYMMSPWAPTIFSHLLPNHEPALPPFSLTENGATIYQITQNVRIDLDFSLSVTPIELISKTWQSYLVSTFKSVHLFPLPLLQPQN